MNSSPYIMVVEDASDIREIIGRLFESEGYDVALAKDGEEALEMLQKASHLPSFILLDLMLPGLDGFQFRAKQELDSRLAEIPIILMTADAHAHEKSIRLGAKGFIRKPVELETLLAVAEKYGERAARGIPARG